MRTPGRLAGDECLPDAAGQLTHCIDIAAPPGDWPWLRQMGCRRAGFYSIDVLDNGGVRSAREIHPELQRLDVEDVMPATPRGREGFEVLRMEPPDLLVLGGLHDVGRRRQLPFGAARPRRYWHVSWAFVLEPLDSRSTRFSVRARGRSRRTSGGTPPGFVRFTTSCNARSFAMSPGALKAVYRATTGATSSRVSSVPRGWPQDC